METEVTSKRRRMTDSPEDDLEALIEMGWPKQGMGSRDTAPKRHRQLQTALILPQGVLIHCPPLSPIRSQPSLLACLIPTATTSGPSKPKIPAATRSYPLPIPAPLSQVPYTYGRPTLLSRSHDASHFLVFWPRLSDTLTSELSQLASAAAATSTKTTTTPNPGSTLNFTQDESYNLDQGGVLALYTKPAPSIRRTTYYYTYDIYSYWNTAYNPITSLFLFEPRKWEVRSTGRRDRLRVDLEADHMHVDSEGRTGGHMNGVLPNGLPNGHTGDDAEHTSVEFVRTPFRGPRSATTGRMGTSTILGFVVLFADHHLNFYSTEKSIPPVNLASETYGETSSTSYYPALDVLRCPLLTPSTVMVEPASGDSANNTTTSADVKFRLIVPGQAKLHVRADDETIWVAFRSYRPRTIWTAPTDDRQEHKIVNDGMAERLSTDPEGSLAGMLDPMREEQSALNRSVRRGPRSVFRGGDEQGQEEDWVDLVEVQLELGEDVLSMSARPVPKLDLPESEDGLLCNSGYRLNGIVFTDPLDADMDETSADEAAESNVQSIASARPFNIVAILTPGAPVDVKSHRRTKIVKYKVSKRNVILSDAFANLGSPALPSKKIDLNGAGRLEWIPQVLQIESIPGDVHVLEGLTSHRYQDVPAAIETPGHRLDRDSTRVVWLDLHDLKLGSEIFESTAGLAEVAYDYRCEMVAWRAADSSRMRLIPLAKSMDADSQEAVEDMADLVCEAILNAEVSQCHVSRLIKSDKERQDVIDNVLSLAWRRLSSRANGISPALGHVAGFVQIQHKIFSATSDERASSAFFMLECLRSLQMFTLSYHATLGRDAQGSLQKEHTYDTSAFWVLMAHMKWYLGVVRAILRCAILKTSGTAESTDQASLLQFMINPVSLRILRDLHNHAQAFAVCASRFSHPLPAHPALSQPGHVDLVSTDLIQMDLRQSLESAGIRLGVFTKIYDFCAEMAQIENPDLGLQDWSSALYLHYTLPDSADHLESRIIAHLTTDDKTIQHQALLFTHQGFTPIEAERLNTDIITKEPLPASTTLAQRQNRMLRQCTQCAHRTACWQIPYSLDGRLPQGIMPAISETDDSSSKWLHQWQNICICGGLWLPT